MSVWNNALVAFSLVWILHGASLSISQPFSPLTDPSWSSSLPVDLLNLEDSGNFERNSVSAQTWVGRVFCCSALAKTQLLLVQPWRDTDNDNDYDNENDCDYAADWSSWWFWSDDDWDYQDGGSDRILGWYWSRWMKQWQYFTYSHPNQVLALAPLLLHISSQAPLLLTSKSKKVSLSTILLQFKKSTSLPEMMVLCSDTQAPIWLDSGLNVQVLGMKLGRRGRLSENKALQPYSVEWWKIPCKDLDHCCTLYDHDFCC